MSTDGPISSVEFGLDRMIAGAGVRPEEVAITKEVATHAEGKLRGKPLIHLATAVPECRQLRWDGTLCPWRGKMLRGRSDDLPGRARWAIREHLKAEHPDMSPERRKLLIRVTTDTLHDWSKGIRGYSNS